MDTMESTTELEPFHRTMIPADALARAISDYLAISRNKNNKSMFMTSSYWPAEEAAWERLQEALERVKNSQ